MVHFISHKFVQADFLKAHASSRGKKKRFSTILISIYSIFITTEKDFTSHGELNFLRCIGQMVP